MGIVSEARRAANRANAQKSTGPKTAAGKQAVRLNAVKHGLCAASTVLKDEDAAAFDRLHADYARRFAPRDEGERAEVRQMAEARWRLGRGMRLETVTLQALIDKEEAGELAPDEVLSVPSLLLRIGRYEGQIQRSYERALERLRLLRSLSAAEASAPARPEKEEPPKRTNPDVARRPDPLPESRKSQFPAHNGFVSSSREGPVRQRLLTSCADFALLAGAPPQPWRFAEPPPKPLDDLPQAA